MRLLQESVGALLAAEGLTDQRQVGQVVEVAGDGACRSVDESASQSAVASGSQPAAASSWTNWKCRCTSAAGDERLAAP